MNRVRLIWPSWVLVFTALMLCMPAGDIGAQDVMVWPLQTDLKSRVEEDFDSFITVGRVAVWNTRDDLKILVESEPYKLAEVSIHVVQPPDDFADILNKKGKPVAGYFDYKTDNLDGTGSEAHSYLHVIPLENFDICWSVKPEICEPNLHIAIQVEVAGMDSAFAAGDGVFPRFDKHDDRIWSEYIVYPIAKVEPGHFVDANVSGLRYETITQDGVTGEEGHFWWLPPESIDFWVGNLHLGTAVADRNVSPVDLFPGSDMDDDRVVNVAWLLQSLDADGMHGSGAISITEPVVACLNSALPAFEPVDFGDELGIGALIDATQAACAGVVELVPLTRDDARENLATGQKIGNLMKKNVSKNAAMMSDKAKLEIMPVYVTARRADDSVTDVLYYDAEGGLLELPRNVAKPIVVAYIEEVDGTAMDGGDKNATDVFVAISRDDGETWKRRNISRTAGRSSRAGYPGDSAKPMLKVKDNMIFVAWTDKYCRGGRPGYAINLCDDPTTEEVETPETGCAVYCTGNPDEVDEVCTPDYPGDDAYWKDDIYGAGGPQRSVIYEDYPEMGEVPFSCVWTARGIIESDGNIQWFKPERVTSGRRDANQLFAGAGDDVAFAIAWQEDPKGLMPGDGDGPGEGWSGANTHNKTDIWLSYITEKDFAKVDPDYPVGGHGDNLDLVDLDPELMGRVKALVPMSLPVKVSDNDVCSLENMDPEGGNGDHLFDEEGQGTHRYCGTMDGIGTREEFGTNDLCVYTVEKTNPKGDVHNVCVTRDGRLLDGNTGASRPMIFVQPYCPKSDPVTKECLVDKSAWVIIGYEESKGVGIPPEGEHDGEEETTDGVIVISSGEDDEARYKTDVGKNVIYHSFELFSPEKVAGGVILNLPETDEYGNPVYVTNEDGTLFLDWQEQPVPAYENARRVRFIPQPKSKMGGSGTVLVALYRQGEEGSGKPADVFMRRLVAPTKGNPYAFTGFVSGAQNLSSVTPTVMFQDPFDAEKPNKMLRWEWSPANLADSSAKNPHSDALAQRGALDGDELIIAYSWTPNWGRNANDKYDLFVRRSFDGGQSWTTDPGDSEPIEHNVAFRVPVIDEVNQIVTWDEEVVTTVYSPGASEPPRNVSNLRNNRISVLEPRLIKTPGTILTDGYLLYPEDKQEKGVFQVAYGIEFNQNQAPNDVTFPKMPLDIYYSRTMDKGQRYETVIVTPQDGDGSPREGWNLLAKDQPEQGAAQLRQTPDGSRMYAVWVENSEEGSDIMFRRVDYRGEEQ